MYEIVNNRAENVHRKKKKRVIHRNRRGYTWIYMLQLEPVEHTTCSTRVYKHRAQTIHMSMRTQCPKIYTCTCTWQIKGEPHAIVYSCIALYQFIVSNYDMVGWHRPKKKKKIPVIIYNNTSKDNADFMKWFLAIRSSYAYFSPHSLSLSPSPFLIFRSGITFPFYFLLYACMSPVKRNHGWCKHANFASIFLFYHHKQIDNKH